MDGRQRDETRVQVERGVGRPPEEEGLCKSMELEGHPEARGRIRVMEEELLLIERWKGAGIAHRQLRI